jgi:hypothetical protein
MLVGIRDSVGQLTAPADMDQEHVIARMIEDNCILRRLANFIRFAVLTNPD